MGLTGDVPLLAGMRSGPYINITRGKRWTAHTACPQTVIQWLDMTGAVNRAASIPGAIFYNRGPIRIEVREQRGVRRVPKGSGALSAPASQSAR